ncbi:MAG: hypothetical protein KKH98_12695 [Spirochaetes bacterium]|nr:hypothetical protein [Spirochaetota bacterium]
MSILPIDIQTILGQMGNAGKIQHVAENSASLQQAQQGNSIHQIAEQKDKQVVDLESVDEEDKKVDADAQKKKEFSHKKNDQEGGSKSDEKSSEFFKDPEKGNIIDVKK